jgi:hypothetical protein
MKKELVIAILTFMTLINLPFLYLYFEEDFDLFSQEEYQKNFLSVPGVKSIEDLSKYEGTRGVTLVIDDGKKIEIWGFDSSIFTNTDWIGLGEINGSKIECRTSKSDTATTIGVNIVSLIKTSSLKIGIRNVEDLIKNFNLIDIYIKNLPNKLEQARVIKMDNMVDKNIDHWCYLL